MKTLEVKKKFLALLCVVFAGLTFGQTATPPAGTTTGASAAVAQVVPNSIQKDIQPRTVYCMKGSDLHPVSYCLDSTPCKSQTNAIGTSTVCLSTATNVPAGATVIANDCWSQQTDYTCMQFNTDCDSFANNQQCTEKGTKSCTQGPTSQLMASTNPKLGGCTSFTRNFVCIDSTTTQTSTTTLSCSDSTTMNGLNWSSTSPSASTDFVAAATSQELARQLATYGTSSGGSVSNLFPGAFERCRDGYFGLKSCCKGGSGGGAATNHEMSVKFGIAKGAFSQGAGYALDTGSQYVFDTLLSNAPQFLTPGVNDMLGKIGSTGWNMANAGFGMYGIGTTAASAASGTFGIVSETSSMAIGQSGLYFNPYALAIALAIQVVMEVMSCDQQEKELANAKAQNLCHYVGSYCSHEVKILGKTVGCLENSQTYCCYNGLLGKAVEEGAHDQLGLSWGSGASPLCDGLSVDMIQKLDFSTPAMSALMKPFADQVMSKFNSNLKPVLSDGTIQASADKQGLIRAYNLCLQKKQMAPATVCVPPPP